MILFLLSALAWGQPPEYTYLERGMEAPFSGRLFNDTASQLLADQIADATDRCQIEMDYQIGILLAEKEQEINKVEKTCTVQIEILGKHLSETPHGFFLYSGLPPYNPKGF